MAEVGSVFVSVVPSLRGFTAKVKSELRDLSITVDLDDDEAKRRLRDFRKKETERDVKLKADLDTLKATRSLRAWAATAGRTSATINVDADTGAALTKIGALAALSAKVGIASLVAPAAIQSVVSLGAALAPTVGALALLPAAAGAGAVGVLTLKAAFSGFGDAIGDDPDKAAEAMAKMAPSAREAATAINGLKPAWAGLQLDVQGRLFAGLGTQISGLGRTYIPILRGAMAGLASDINGSVKDAFATLRESGNVSGITVGLGFVRQGLGSMSTALAPLTQAFTSLFVAGAPYVATFGQWVSDTAARFSLFIGEASRGGEITVWIDNAIFTFKQLFSIIGNIGSILGSVFGAVQTSGGGALGTLQLLTGEIASGLKTPAGAEGLRTFFGSIHDTVQAALPGVRSIGSALSSVISNIGPALPSVGFAFSMVAESLRPFVEALGWLVGAILPPLMNALGFLSPALVPIALGIGVLVGIAKGWIAVQAILNGELWAMTAALLANPITWVIAAILALVGVVIYAWNNWTWFREAVQAAWAGIVTAAQWAWTNILQPIFGFMGTVLTAIGTAFVWLWQQVIVPAWTAISGAISAAWTGFIWPVLSAIGTALGYLGLAIATILVAPFVIAWNAISALVSAVWTNVLQPIWYGAIVPALQFLGSMFTWLWQNVVVPVWDGIVGAIQTAWTTVSGIFNAVMAFLSGVFAAAWNTLYTGVIQPVWNGIKSAIDTAWNFIRDNIFTPINNFLRGTLGPVFQWLWHEVIEPVWNGIKSAISGAWDFIKGVFNTGKTAVDQVGQAFQSVADWIGRAWDTIREAARKPVQWVVDVVYNNGIRNVWNGIAGMFGMTQLPAVRFAEGGVLPGYAPGRDSVPALLSRGEGILVPEAVRGLGPGFVGWANRTFSGGRSKGGAGTPGQSRFADGGIVGGIGSALSGTADFFMSVFTDPAAAVKKLFSGVLGDGGNTPGTGSWTGALKNLPGKAIEGIIGKIKKWVEEIGSMGGGGDWGPVAAQALAITGQPQSLLWRVLKQIQIESGGNPRAINLWDSNARKGTPSKGLIQTIDPTFQAYRMPGLPNDPYNPLSNIVAGIRYAIARYGSIANIWPKTLGYDSGGVLPPGVSMAVNATGGNERMAVFTMSQWTTLQGVMVALQNLPSSVNNLVGGVRDTMRTVGQQMSGAASMVTTSAQSMVAATRVVTQAVQAVQAQVQTVAARANMVRAEDGSYVPKSYYAKPVAKPVVKSGYVRAEDGSLVPKSFYSKTSYDRGGIASGLGIMAKATIHPERVLSPRQTQAFESLVATMARRSPGIGPGVYDGMSPAGAGGPAIGAVYQQLPDGVSSRRMVEELTFELRRNGLASGVHG